MLTIPFKQYANALKMWGCHKICLYMLWDIGNCETLTHTCFNQIVEQSQLYHLNGTRKQYQLIYWLHFLTVFLHIWCVVLEGQERLLWIYFLICTIINTKVPNWNRKSYLYSRLDRYRRTDSQYLGMGRVHVNRNGSGPPTRQNVLNVLLKETDIVHDDLANSIKNKLDIHNSYLFLYWWQKIFGCGCTSITCVTELNCSPITIGYPVWQIYQNGIIHSKPQ